MSSPEEQRATSGRPPILMGHTSRLKWTKWGAMAGVGLGTSGLAIFCYLLTINHDLIPCRSFSPLEYFQQRSMPLRGFFQVIHGGGKGDLNQISPEIHEGFGLPREPEPCIHRDGRPNRRKVNSPALTAFLSFKAG